MAKQYQCQICGKTIGRFSTISEYLNNQEVYLCNTCASDLDDLKVLPYRNRAIKKLKETITQKKASPLGISYIQHICQQYEIDPDLLIPKTETQIAVNNKEHDDEIHKDQTKEYKVVPAPKGFIFVPDKKKNNNTKVAFETFENIINRESQDGWCYHSMETITVSERTCSGAVSTNYYMLIFEREVKDLYEEPTIKQTF